MAIAASIGKSELLVAKDPRISIVTTGDELVDIATHPLPHQIRRSNDLSLFGTFALRDITKSSDSIWPTIGGDRSLRCRCPF